MPKSTFFRLPEEKREKLVAAANRELERAPFAEMSINRIIKDAGVSRGSFYQYFADKTDMLDYLVSRYFEDAAALAERCAAECGGDVFAAFKLMLTRVAAIMRCHASISQNLFTYMRSRDFMPQYAEMTQSRCIEFVRSRIRASGITVETGFESAVALLMMTLTSSIARLTLNPEAEREISEDLSNKLDILKRGMGVPAADGEI